MKLTPAQFEALKKGYTEMREQQRARYGNGQPLPYQTPADEPNKTLHSNEMAQ